MSIHTINSSMNELKSVRNFVTAEKRPFFSILSVSIGITDKTNAADLLCMQECRQTKDRANVHLVDSHNLLIELSSPSVKSVVYIKVDLRIKMALNPKF